MALKIWFFFGLSSHEVGYSIEGFLVAFSHHVFIWSPSAHRRAGQVRLKLVSARTVVASEVEDTPLALVLEGNRPAHCCTYPISDNRGRSLSRRICKATGGVSIRQNARS
jgi:hypothetical protein